MRSCRSAICNYQFFQTLYSDRRSKTINKSKQFVSDRRSAAINFSGGYDQIADLNL